MQENYRSFLTANPPIMKTNWAQTKGSRKTVSKKETSTKKLRNPLKPKFFLRHVFQKKKPAAKRKIEQETSKELYINTFTDIFERKSGKKTSKKKEYTRNSKMLKNCFFFFQFNSETDKAAGKGDSTNGPHSKCSILSLNAPHSKCSISGSKCQTLADVS